MYLHLPTAGGIAVMTWSLCVRPIFAAGAFSLLTLHLKLSWV
jgi:hypothetical protein